jgi:Cytochrome c biogenesis factor
MALGPKAKWIKNKFENLKVYFLIIAGAIGLNFIIIFFFKSYSLLSNFIIISALFLIIASLVDLAKALKKTKLDLARIISHTSFGFLVLFIGLNDVFSVEKDYNIKVGETKQFESYSIQLQSLDLKKYKNYQAVVGKLEIKNLNSNKTNTLNPEIRIYDKPKTLTYEAAIKTNLIKDYYLTMSNIDRSEYYNIKFQKKPLMAWIWISVIMIVVGGFVRLFSNAKNS